MRKLLFGLAAILAFAVFAIAIQPRTTVNAACPQTPADCHHERDRTPIPVPATATPVPATLNPCRSLDSFGQRFRLDPITGQCFPVVLAPALPPVVCTTGNITQTLATTNGLNAYPYGNGIYNGYNGYSNPLQGNVYYINGQPYMNGVPINAALYPYSGFNNYPYLGSAQVVQQCNAPAATPTPVTNTVYVPLPAPAAAPVVAPSLPSSFNVRPPNTGDAGLLASP